MRAFGYALRSPTATALRTAAHEFTADTRVDCEVVLTPSMPIARAVADLVALDLTTTAPLIAHHEVVALLRRMPFTRVVVVSTIITKAHEQRLLFQLGQAGVTDLLDAAQADQPFYWRLILDDCTGFNVLRQFHDTLVAMLPIDERAAFILDVSRHVQAASVKDLGDRMFPDVAAAAVTKRHKLWQACQRLKLPSPEQVLIAVRLVLLKVLLDDGRWTGERIAQYLGYENVRHLSRSCRQRYGVGINALRHIPLPVIGDLVTQAVLNGSPLNQLGPHDNQTDL